MVDTKTIGGNGVRGVTFMGGRCVDLAKFAGIGVVVDRNFGEI